MEMVKLERTVDGKRETCMCLPEQVEQMTNPLHTIGEKKRAAYSANHKPHAGWTVCGEVDVAIPDQPAPTGAQGVVVDSPIV